MYLHGEPRGNDNLAQSSNNKHSQYPDLSF